MTTISRKLGCLRDWRDPRDDAYAYRPPRSADKYLAARAGPIDLRPRFGPVRDQMQTSACVGFAVAAAYEFLYPDKAPLSPWFAYYLGRNRGRVVGWDAGCSIRDCLKEAAKLGIAPEAQCPFPISYATAPVPGSWETASVLGMPLDAAFDAALAIRGCTYRRVDQRHIPDCLAEGFPVIAGIPMYLSAFTPYVERTGHVPVPGLDDPLVGGHAVLIVSKSEQGMEGMGFRNSWNGWGDGGYGTLPVGYPLSDGDFWTVRKPE